ncbi:Tudor-knot domain-containing protein [Ferruginibacter sp. SUN002]|uniref:Tudor-knot domain-containing protein n=1 Tax=Ferruginibacter sp. SUN002 TaxID=2937789 RepID=UPI003D35B7DD
MFKAFSFFLLLFLLGSLKLSAQRTDTVYIVKHDTITVLRYVRDTVYSNDKRLLKPKEKKQSKPISTFSNTYKVGDKVMVVWNGDWYPATIIEQKDQQYKITYDGFSSSWDEYVTPDRIKKRE